MTAGFLSCTEGRLREEAWRHGGSLTSKPPLHVSSQAQNWPQRQEGRALKDGRELELVLLPSHEMALLPPSQLLCSLQRPLASGKATCPGRALPASYVSSQHVSQLFFNMNLCDCLITICFSLLPLPLDSELHDSRTHVCFLSLTRLVQAQGGTLPILWNE